MDSSPTPGQPVDVTVKVVIKAIQQIDPKCGTTKLLFDVHYTWAHSRVAKACEQDTQDLKEGKPLFRPPRELWKPGLKISNGIDESQYTVNSDHPEVRICDRSEGKLSMEIPFTGEVDNPMDLKGFPFDEDSIDIRLCGRRMRDGSAADASDFVLRTEGSHSFEFLFDHHLPEYQLLGISYVEYTKWGNSYVTLGINVRRKHAYYFFKVTILMWLIVLLAMPTFLFGFGELEQRMALTATMFLATAATLYIALACGEGS